ncbi:MAG: exodeoxyribonuclease VII small subunit [Vulcanimicrobiaceae bacterium]
MTEPAGGAFEQRVQRLESIVKELEGGSVELDRAVALFKEGKALASECESLLKVAQEQIDRAMESGAAPGTGPAAGEDIPF